MLVDTGSHLSVVSREVFDSPGVDLSRLSAARRVRAVGIGGSQEYLRVRLTISFPTSTPERRPMPIWVSVPVASGSAESILGMESLAAFRLTVSAGEDRVELEPLFDGG
jgi:hypothetical protein